MCVLCKAEEGADDDSEDEDEVYEPSDEASEEGSSEEGSDESNWSAENESSGSYNDMIVLSTINFSRTHDCSK